MSFRPWLDPQDPIGFSRAERYVLIEDNAGTYLGIDSSTARIKEVDSQAQAWTFHTHEKAVVTARQVASVLGKTVGVLKVV